MRLSVLKQYAFKWGFWVVIGICGFIIFWLTSAFLYYTQDDVFITYTYSRNIAQGNGFVFNLGEQVQGTTTPLWALIMAGVYLITPNLLIVGNLLGGIFLLLLVILSISLVRQIVHIYSQFTLGILIVTAPLFYLSFGMETLLYCVLLSLSFFLWSKDKPAFAFATAGLLTWTRADGIILAGTLMLVALFEWLWSKKLATPQIIQSVILYSLVIAPWFLFAYFYFGSFTPNTLSAKANLLAGIEFLNKGWQLRDSLYNNNLFHWLALLLIPIGLWRAIRIPKVRPLALWTIFYLIGYTSLNVSYFWYYTPLLWALIVLAVFGADQILRVIWLYRPYPIIKWVCLFILFLSAIWGVSRTYENRHVPTRMETYRLIGEWIEQQTPPDATIGVADLGIVGYYAQRRTIDSFGLIMRDMYHYTPDYMAIRYKPEFIVATQFFIFQRFVNEAWFSYHFKPIVAISTHQDTEFSPMTVYQRRFPLETPQIVYIGNILPLTCIVELQKDAILPGETFARLYRDDILVRQDAHLFLWHRYPAPASLGNELLIEQLAFPTTNLIEGEYRWELDCDRQLSGSILLRPLADAPNYIALDNVIWENFAQLNGVVVQNSTQIWSGGSITLSLDWGAKNQPSPQNYILNLELIDTQGAIKNGENMPPYYPTSTWLEGDMMAGEWSVTLPPDLPSGEYRLQMGWFHEETLERLPIGEDTTYILPITFYNQFPGGSGRP